MMGEPTTITEMYKLLSQQNQEQTNALTGHIRNSEESLRRDIQKSNQKLEKVEKNNILLERRIRRNNILFFTPKGENHEANSNSLIKNTISKLNELFSIEITIRDINNIQKFGKGDAAPILVEFISYLRKSELFKDTEKLRNLRAAGYGIANDLCEEDRRDLKILKQHLKRAREQNKVAKIKGLKLEIYNTLYTAQELEELFETTEEGSSDSEESVEEEEEGEIKEKGATQASLSHSGPGISGPGISVNKNKRKEKTPTPEGRKTRSTKKKRY